MDDRLLEAFKHHVGEWPLDLTSGVMFWSGLRITVDEFNNVRSRNKLKILSDLITLSHDLYSEGYMCGINSNSEQWHEAWAIAMFQVSDGEPYNNDIVIDIYSDIMKRGK